MTRETLAELFIRTVTELRDQDLEYPGPPPRIANRSRIVRSTPAFPAGADESRIPSVWRPRHNQPWQEAIIQIHFD